MQDLCRSLVAQAEIYQSIISYGLQEAGSAAGWQSVSSLLSYLPRQALVLQNLQRLVATGHAAKSPRAYL